MKHGRELDALVAEKVMGWKLAYASERFMNWTMPTGELRTQETDSSFRSFQPSTEISAAWEVVEELKRRDFVLNVNAPWDDPVNARPGASRYWCVMIAPTFGLGISYQRLGANADTAPHAICLAALKAVGYAKD